MTFVRRRLEAIITLAAGNFGEGNGDTIRLAGLRMGARMSSYGADAMGQIQMRVFGLPLHMVNQLTTIGPIATEIRGKNRLVVLAGDEGGALATVFDGTINTAWGDFNGAPDVVFNVQGFAGLKDALKPIPPSSYKGAAPVQDVLENLADIMGLSFENNGVDVRLNCPYLAGTALDQVRSVCRAADINYVIDCGVLAIWPRRGARKGEIPVMSSKTGMVGYPAFTGNGVSISSIFTPSCKQGGKVKVESELTPAAGEWVIATVQHELEAMTPGGAWFTHLECVRTAP